jgi:hypothetical protein
MDDIQKPWGTRLRNSKEGQTDLRDVTRNNNTQSYVLRVLDSSVDRRDW